MPCARGLPGDRIKSYYDKSIALVIGIDIDDYPERPLHSAVNDARGVARVLEEIHHWDPYGRARNFGFRVAMSAHS